MNRLQQDIDELDRMVDTDASKDAIRSQIRLIGREVAALEADYVSLADQHAQLQNQSTASTAFPMEHRRGLYFTAGDPVPFCPHCWEAWQRKIHLSGPVPLFDSKRERWDCYTCKTVYGAGAGESFMPHPVKT